MTPARNRFLTIVLFALALGAAEAPQRDPSGFRYAVPGRELAFPRDHGAHPEFQIEWWYFTGNLRGDSGREYGFELTFFRVGVEPPSAPRRTAWDLRDLALAHFAITDVSGGRFRYVEKVNRGSRFTADAAEGALDIFNEGWSATAQPDGSWRIRAGSPEMELDLVLRSRKPPAVHGEAGVSVKGDEPGAASHYYSMTRLEAEGSIRAGETAESCAGLAWMDHEFSTSV
ncbi:MAG: lipocalin-like domain-containing protein, partial [Thermoanaerobaculia bacterium]